MTNSTMTLAELVTAEPGSARVLHRHGLDFCCGGRRSLEEACRARGIDPGVVLEELTARESVPEEVHVEQLSQPALIDFILTRYHEPLRPELARLVALAEKVERVHAAKPACPRGLAAHLHETREAIEDHLAKEEQILFPLIHAGRGRYAHMPIRVMIQEHDDHGENLRAIRSLTGNLTVPAEACNSWRLLYQGLEGLELELMQHIHIENNILFPRALAETN